MAIRMFTGSLFGLVFLTMLFIGGIPLLVFCLFAAGIGVAEFIKMAKKKQTHPFFYLFCLLYILAGFLWFYVLRMSQGMYFAFFILLVVWATDSFAYFVGRKIGRKKLAPSISPNKTWEGTIGGTVLALAFASIYFVFVPLGIPFILYIILAALISVSGQIGDLLESYVKRFYSVKDSGRLLPGHGGILDRFDSLLLVSMVTTIFITAYSI